MHFGPSLWMKSLKKLMAFQTHEGVFAWSRLTMGCHPASQVQQTAFHTAMDKYMPPEWRHRIALYADDKRYRLLVYG